jgi:hypothetical protein
MKRRHRVPERIVRDTRRDAWILVVPTCEFIADEFTGDVRLPENRALLEVTVRRAARAASARPLPVADRVIPWVMLVWAGLVWTFLFYDLGHL